MKEKNKNKLGHDEKLYLRNLKGIKKAFSLNKDWKDVIRSDYFFTDDDISMEAFISSVERVYKTKIENAEKLEELTKIKKPLEGKITLEQILIKSNYSKYYKAVVNELNEKGKYESLFKIEPKDFNLPPTWEGTLGTNKQETILYAIALTYNLSEPGQLVMLPNIRHIANQINAPYSALMNAINLFK